MPFRVYCFNQVSKVFVVSKKGAEYTRGLNICPEKVMANYSGLNDYGFTREFKGDIRIISCSNLIKLKRINIIIEALREIDIPITWKHFGDGEQRTELTRIAKELPDHVKWSFEGHVSHDNLMKVYTDEHWTCFLHMSESEGLPLALAEAMSFGIPVIACEVGGVSEIVSEKEGYLLPKNVDPEKVCNIIKEISTDQMLQKQLSKNAREKYLKHFSAQKNYSSFVKYVKEFG